jgi:uncharacterized membrane protein YebE (DUF533 family)
MLQEAFLQGARPEDPDFASVVELLRRATQEHELGNYSAENQLLAQAHGQLSDMLLRRKGTGDTQRRIVLLLLILAAAGVAWWVWKEQKKKKRKRRLRFQPNENPALAELDLDEEEDDDEDDE